MIRDRRIEKQMENGIAGNGHVVGEDEDENEETPLLADR